MKKIKTVIKLILSNDPLFRFEILRRIGKVLLPVYRFKWPQMEWWYDKFFNDYLIKFDEMNGMNSDRRWMQYQLLRLTENVPGDTAECGVYKGAGSYLICKFNQGSNLFKRKHYMFDSFEGLSEPTGLDGVFWKKGDLFCPEDIVKKNLSDFTDISFHKGWVPQRFNEIAHLNFSFVHIDLDLYRPTLESFKFFYPRMNNGGVIICDDYGFTSCLGATKAADQFLADKKEKMISLSGGGGFLIKGIETSKTS